MKIEGLRIEGFMRLKIVDIVLSKVGNIIKITGRNKQGKTALLTAITTALYGKAVIPKNPINDLQDEATVELDLGPYKVTRTFERDDNGKEWTTELVIRDAAGAKKAEPQTLLKSLQKEICFDPLLFLNNPKERFTVLRGFCPHIKFEELKLAHDNDFSTRALHNKLVKQHRAAGEAVVVPPGARDELIDMDAIQQKLDDAIEENKENAERRNRRENLKGEVAARKLVINNTGTDLAQYERAQIQLRDQLKQGINDQIEELRERILQLEEQRAGLDSQCETQIRDATAQRQGHNRQLEALVEFDEKRLAEAPPIPEDTDTAGLLAEMTTARQTNAATTKLLERVEHYKKAKEEQATADALTKSIVDRKQQIKDDIAAVALPVKDLTFDEDGNLFLAGQPFDNASGREKLRASFAIGARLAGGPDDIRLALIKDSGAALLDSEGWAEMDAIAQEFDVQVWCELVDETKKVGIVMEGGEVIANNYSKKKSA